MKLNGLAKKLKVGLKLQPINRDVSHHYSYLVIIYTIRLYLAHEAMTLSVELEQTHSNRFMQQREFWNA